MIKILISNFVPSTWPIDLNFSRVYISLFSTHLDKSLVVHGFLQWWGSHKLRQSSQLTKRIYRVWDLPETWATKCICIPGIYKRERERDCITLKIILSVNFYNGRVLTIESKDMWPHLMIELSPLRYQPVNYRLTNI